MNDRQHDSSMFRFADVFDLNSYYWQTRQWRYFRQGIPAIAVSLLVLIPALAYPLTRRHSARRYQVAFNQAVKQENYETANLFLRKLEDLPTEQLESRELKFNQALTDFARGQVDQAIAAMEDLAPSDAAGYGPAHLWLANLHMSQDPSMAGPGGESMVHHFESALKHDAENTSIHLILGNYYYRTGNRAKAVKHLQSAVDSHPELHFILANLYESLDDQEHAEKQFRLATEFLAANLTKNANDEELRINLAVAHFKLGEFTKAVQTISAAVTASPKLVNVLSSFYLTESDRLRMSAKPNDPNFAKSLMLLSKALQLAPDNQAAINRIALIASYQGETAEKAIETLKSLLAAGKMTATAHVMLGTSALNRGEDQKAKLHFSQAYRLNPRMPALLNNVAWMLMQEEPPRLEKALVIVNQAIEQTPRDSPILAPMIETRGQIFVRLKRWNEALTDLEFALERIPDNQEIHRSLAAVYRALGEEEMAAKHAERGSR